MAMGLAVAALLLTARRHLRERSARRANADAVADAEGGARHPPRRTGRGERQEKELLVMPTAAATDLRRSDRGRFVAELGRVRTPGRYDVVVDYAGDDAHRATSSTFTLRVVKKKG